MDKVYFPMFVDISEKRILMVGGGKIAARRVGTLLQFAQDITVVAPKICDPLKAYKRQGVIRVLERKWQEEDIRGCEIVLAATDDRDVNQQVAMACRNQGILVNVADDKTACDFYFPGVVLKEDVVIGISSSGKDPQRTKEIVKGVDRNL